jgi:hypothetical protein
VMRARILRSASMSCAEAPSPLRPTLNTPKRCARPPGRSRRRRFPPKAGRPSPKGWRILVLAVGLTPGPWWLRPLLIVSLPFGLGFFHEVGAKLLVEIGPKDDADTIAP